MELVKGEKGRYIKIDGKKVKVESCRDCPCFAYDRSGDGPWCKHPLLENAVLDEDCKIGRGCPLREVNE